MQNVFSMNVSLSSLSPSVSARLACNLIAYEQVGQVEMLW